MDIRRGEYNNKQAILLFGRDTGGNRICVIDDSLVPYFYVIPKPGVDVASKLEKIEVERDDRISKVNRTELVKKKYYGKEVEAIKVYVDFVRDIQAIKSVIDEWEIIEGIYEHDAPYITRYLSEKGFFISNLLEFESEPVNAGFSVNTFYSREIESKSADFIKSPRVLAFDIETHNPSRKIDMKNNPIIMISFIGQDYKKVVTWKRVKTDLDYVEFVNSELELVEKFTEIVERFEPDVITGYNSDAFDFNYIIIRAKKYKINLNIGLDNSGIVIPDKDFQRARITGIVNIDLFRYLKSSVSLQGGYTLSNAATKLVGMDKKEIELDRLYDIWDKGNEELNEYFEYTLVDAELAYRICMKCLPNILEMAKITGMAIDRLTRHGYSKIVETFLISMAQKMDEIIPNKPDKNEIARRFLDSYRGSYVIDPKPGLYENIIIFDFKSLYPTIIVSHNISPETMDCECCEKGVNVLESEHHFCEKKKGFLAVILEDLITRRSRIKEMQTDNIFLKAREENLKLLANSFYGYLGFFGARWYSIVAAKIVTSWGRYYIKQVIEKAQNEKFSVIYSDTDSIFIALQDRTVDEAREFVTKVNASLPGVMELEFEGTYKRGIFVEAKDKTHGAKKKYALIGANGDLKIRGFESVRKNWSAVAREVQQNVLEMILKSGNAKLAKDYLDGIIDSIKKKELENKKMIIETTLQKKIDSYDIKGPHVIVAEKMKEKGTPVEPGMKISYIIVAGEGKISDRATLPEEVAQGEYDSDYYINNQIIPAIEKIFELFEVKKEDISLEKEQKKLGEF